jgi:uncharacterized protein
MGSPSSRRKVLFGTNYPMILPAQAFDGLDRLGLDHEATNLYLGGNAQRLLGDPRLEPLSSPAAHGQ